MNQFALIHLRPGSDAVDVTVAANEAGLLRPIISAFMDDGFATSRANAVKVQQILANAGRWPYPSGAPRFYCVRETWPWLDSTSGAIIQEDRFYGFGDAGGLAGSFEGYVTATVAINDIVNDYGQAPEWLSFKPEDLGSVAITVITGRDFITQLYRIHACDSGGVSEGLLAFEGAIAEYGTWSVDD